MSAFMQNTKIVFNTVKTPFSYLASKFKDLSDNTKAAIKTGVLFIASAFIFNLAAKNSNAQTPMVPITPVPEYAKTKVSYSSNPLLKDFIGLNSEQAILYMDKILNSGENENKELKTILADGEQFSTIAVPKNTTISANLSFALGDAGTSVSFGYGGGPSDIYVSTLSADIKTSQAGTVITKTKDYSWAHYGGWMNNLNFGLVVPFQALDTWLGFSGDISYASGPGSGYVKNITNYMLVNYNDWPVNLDFVKVADGELSAGVSTGSSKLGFKGVVWGLNLTNQNTCNDISNLHARSFMYGIHIDPLRWFCQNEALKTTIYYMQGDCGKQTTVSAGVGIDWQVSDSFGINALVSYEKNNSTMQKPLDQKSDIEANLNFYYTISLR